MVSLVQLYNGYRVCGRTHTHSTLRSNSIQLCFALNYFFQFATGWVVLNDVVHCEPSCIHTWTIIDIDIDTRGRCRSYSSSLPSPSSSSSSLLSSATLSVGRQRLARKSDRLLWHVLTNYFVFAVDHNSLALNESKHNLSMVGFPNQLQSIARTHAPIARSEPTRERRTRAHIHAHEHLHANTQWALQNCRLYRL